MFVLMLQSVSVSKCRNVFMFMYCLSIVELLGLMTAKL